MASWSSRRKLMYGGSVVLVLLAIIIAVFFLVFYKKPTCYDGVKNGDEQGIDCGGSCVKLCQTAFLPPRITWGGAKFEKVANGLYNVAAYVENQNVNAAAVNVPYKITLFDPTGDYIGEQNGYMNIPPHRNTLVFVNAVNVEKRIPGKATFEFTQAPVWFKSHDTLGDLSIADKNYTEDASSSALEVTLVNNGIVPYNNLKVGVVLYDNQNNAIGFSQTQIDQIAPNGGSQIAPFTWPVGRQGRVTSIEVLPIGAIPQDP